MTTTASKPAEDIVLYRECRCSKPESKCHVFVKVKEIIEDKGKGKHLDCDSKHRKYYDFSRTKTYLNELKFRLCLREIVVTEGWGISVKP